MSQVADLRTAAPALLAARAQQAVNPPFAPSRALREHLLRHRQGEGWAFGRPSSSLCRLIVRGGMRPVGFRRIPLTVSQATGFFIF